ncbi:type II secretion system F family protein [Serinicoccus kebangsaanensis]|uniref:type II secretion system F family protein n=1 Tax=Serinicoccus kebangsaanensis TaxID=2602069 RepID=UPI00124F4E9C|nr:type II secretion system F family protein [Serinicoccus kebangsaanensis]
MVTTLEQIGTGWLVPALAVTAGAAVLVLLRGAPDLAREQAGASGRPGAPGRPRAGAGALLRRVLPGTAARAGLDRRTAEELDVVDTIAAALETGLPVPRAVALATDGRPRAHPGRATDWEALARASLDGQSLVPTWERVARSSDSPTLSSVARAWQVASRTGAPLAAALRVSAHAARERQRLERAVDTASAGARATATVLTWLPLAGIGLSAVVGIGPASLYATPVAWACLAAGATLLLVGQVMVRRLMVTVLQDVR